MRLESINNMMGAEFRKIDRTNRKNRDTASKETKAPQKDSATFSGTKTPAQGQAKQLAARVSIEPEVRQDRIQDVQNKIEKGYYNTSEFADKLADRLIKDLGFDG
ncbi:flagellar biosynthesis anti-sigma factor FlgM [Chitinivibrio alkaliphilus]|uniref:Anti-sigma-28 factor FlgM C-terminal domain-containing protein n=1 Tax=Chitinivibrio alkaliphilus ACht1 TaxID=1313304 RepID=U7D9J5_9BACT|nr:flagellar biosynthesis anti-sigma factor FlgM [Chitinivibrio alkaliphilus]ERP31085.1 hypothetical protein CALK_2045 [Chitinivibrio alkaliphilus ACht1]